MNEFFGMHEEQTKTFGYPTAFNCSVTINHSFGGRSSHRLTH